MNRVGRKVAVALTLLATVGIAAGVTSAGQATASVVATSTTPTPAPPPPPPPPTPPTPSGAAQPAAVKPAALATNVQCGQVIAASITMNGDLYCSGAGLTINKASVNLNLGGHTIYGPGAESGYLGVTVTGATDTVQNGTIEGFGNGVLIEGTADAVTKVVVQNGYTGLFDQGAGTKLTTVMSRFNAYGIYGNAFGGSSTYAGVVAANNALEGIFVRLGSATITGGGAYGNGSDGLYMSDGGSVKSFVANDNTDYGIAVVGTATDLGGNTAKGNNAGGVQCYGAACN